MLGIALSENLGTFLEWPETVLHGMVNAAPQKLIDFEPPAVLSDLWVFSFLWTSIMVSSTVGAMKDRGASTPWQSHVAMIPIRITLGYSLMGVFMAAATIPICFVRLKTGDDDLDRYTHWVRVFTFAFVFCVIILFILNSSI